MGKPKRWHIFLIVAAVCLTIYNILPTLFFYSKPLKEPIGAKRAETIALQMAARVNGMEEEAVLWVKSFARLLGVKPVAVELDGDNPQLLRVKFGSTEEAGVFGRYLPRAGSLIAAPSAQLQLYGQDLSSKTVTVERRIPIHFKPTEMSAYFHFGRMQDGAGKPTDFYRELVCDRVATLGASLTGPSENSSLLQLALADLSDPAAQDFLAQVCQNLLQGAKIFDKSPSIRARFFASFAQSKEVAAAWLAALDTLKDQIRLEQLGKEAGQRAEFLQRREALFSEATAVMRKQMSEFAVDVAHLSFAELTELLRESDTLQLRGAHPFVESLTIDWAAETIVLNFYEDVQSRRKALTGLAREHFDQLLFNEIATLSRLSGEAVKPSLDKFVVALKALPGSQSFLALKLAQIATQETEVLRQGLGRNWTPHHPDLQKGVFPIWDYETYENLQGSDKMLGLLVFSPSTLPQQAVPKGFKLNSVYVVARGVDKILRRYETSSAEGARQFLQDFNALRELLQQHGFVGYSGASFPVASEFRSDFIFEKEDYYQDVLNASYENFAVHGSKRYALLEFSTVEERIAAENRIDDKIHENLLRWRDDFRAAQVDLKGRTRFDVPKPVKNAFWENFKLSCVKYFRGDLRKVVQWGLDLSGGKTVELQLQDAGGAVVSGEADLTQGMKELYSRVNKMGVSEVSIRREGTSIALDFPGSQSLSAAELVQSSSMFFHIVNEKFMTSPSLASTTATFLQEVWNEAVVTGRKSEREINGIAWRHLYGESEEAPLPRSGAAKTLYDSGLRLSSAAGSSELDETLSKIALYRGDDYAQWHGQTHPLLIVFNNYALEGSNLDSIYASYDPSRGNFLGFSVKGSGPKAALHAWSSQFAKEKISGTEREVESRGRGWRMAAILNGSVITAPMLDSPLQGSASITGSFTQREINRLEADLKAGSLSFTPHILSEKNVSPELGTKERFFGVIAMLASLALAVAAMTFYYRFGGVIASIAVMFNLLILWAALQNLGAALTLAGIAGIILTVAMAVDANVLVFERIREEFTRSGRLASAIASGYKKAFSAIIDSNITTIIAAVVLLNFDAGPIRGLAITLIIGIVSSLFTALFMTRTFFNWWALNPKHRELKMANLIGSTQFNFLKFTKPTILVSAVIIVCGAFFFATHHKTILGMDFTGGYALTVDLPLSTADNYRTSVETALTQQGLSPHDFHVRELNPKNQVRIFLSRSLEQKGRPFYALPQTTGSGGYPFEGNAQMVWIVDALQQSGIHLSPATLQTLDSHWTAVSGQLSQTMQRNAFFGIAVALLAILGYITLRFEFNYAISATLCLAHDVAFCLAAIALLNLLGVPIQLDLHTIAALMMIVGYSLNDTIIVFDRIREEMRTAGNRPLLEIVNYALNVTLSRTLMTSGITLLVLLPLILLGGVTLLGFALVMAIGVVFGTLSSLFVAAPLMLAFHRTMRVARP